MSYYDRAMLIGDQLKHATIWTGGQLKDATNQHIVQPWRDSQHRAEQLKQHVKRLEEAVIKYNEYYESDLALDANNGIYFADARHAANMTYALNGDSLIPTIVLKSKHGDVSPHIYLWRFDKFDQFYFNRPFVNFTLTMDGATNTYTSMKAFVGTIPYGTHWRELEEDRFNDMGYDMKGHSLYWESQYSPDHSRFLRRPQWQLDEDKVKEALRRSPEHRLHCTTCDPCKRRGRIENIVGIISGREVKHTHYSLQEWCYSCHLPHVYWLHGSYENGSWRTEPWPGQKETTCAENEEVLLAMEKFVRKCNRCAAQGVDRYFIRRNRGSKEDHKRESYGMNPREGIETQGLGFGQSLVDDHQRWHDGEEDKLYDDKEIEDFFPLDEKFNITPTYKGRGDWFVELRQFHLNNMNGTNILDYL
jgi:hypothetical protein